MPASLRRTRPSTTEDSPILRTSRRSRLDLRPVAMPTVSQTMARLRVQLRLPPTLDSTGNPVGTASLDPGARRQVEALYFRVTPLKTLIAGSSTTGSPSFGTSTLPKPDPPHRLRAGDPSYARQAPLWSWLCDNSRSNRTPPGSARLCGRRRSGRLRLRLEHRTRLLLLARPSRLCGPLFLCAEVRCSASARRRKVLRLRCNSARSRLLEPQPNKPCWLDSRRNVVVARKHCRLVL